MSNGGLEIPNSLRNSKQTTQDFKVFYLKFTMNIALIYDLYLLTKLQLKGNKE